MRTKAWVVAGLAVSEMVRGLVIGWRVLVRERAWVKVT
jgi:hypothetical protein